tara:strand:+ start:65680 stop:67020 length:1341 start_codon:yes stop_codon:yes gene_type:complete
MQSKNKLPKNYSSSNLIKHVENLFPICRSITGKGSRKTLSYFESYFNVLKRIKFKSGEKVFDWEIPPEWNIKDAYIEHLDSGKKFANFEKNNLHVVGYSKAIQAEMELDILLENIYSLPDNPDWIPYVTSYYEKRWGFCLSHNEKKNLPKGLYKVKIDSEFKEKGSLELSHAIIKGKKNKELFFSSYICHPSMANNELSGPVILGKLIDYVNNNYPHPKNSYRYVLLPETIGSIAYLSKFSKLLKKNVICGINLSCVGDERAYSHVESPYGNTLADEALNAALLNLDNVKKYSFLKRGSDERQYCSPKINLPLCTFCRSKFGEYPEYHTSADLPNTVVTDKGLNDSFQILKNIIDAFEFGIYPLPLINCEPQLSKRGLMSSLSKRNIQAESRNTLNILAYCNGKNTIFDICKITNLNLKIVLLDIKRLTKYKIIKCFQSKQNPITF